MTEALNGPVTYGDWVIYPHEDDCGTWLYYGRVVGLNPFIVRWCDLESVTIESPSNQVFVVAERDVPQFARDLFDTETV